MDRLPATAMIFRLRWRGDFGSGRTTHVSLYTVVKCWDYGRLRDECQNVNQFLPLEHARFTEPLPRPTISLDSDLREYRTGGSRCPEEEIQNPGVRREPVGRPKRPRIQRDAGRAVVKPVAPRPLKTLRAFHFPTGSTVGIIHQLPHPGTGPDFAGRSIRRSSLLPISIT